MEQVQAFVNSMMGQTLIIGAILDAVFRMMKTEKPLSIAHLAAKVIRQAADIAMGMANFLDKVLPQKLK